MESLDFVVLFTVVVVAWVDRMARVYGFVSSVKHNWVLLGKEQILIGMSMGALCSVGVPVATKRFRVTRLRGDRTIDPARGRPPLSSD